MLCYVLTCDRTFFFSEMLKMWWIGKGKSLAWSQVTICIKSSLLQAFRYDSTVKERESCFSCSVCSNAQRVLKSVNFYVKIGFERKLEILANIKTYALPQKIQNGTRLPVKPVNNVCICRHIYCTRYVFVITRKSFSFVILIFSICIKFCEDLYSRVLIVRLLQITRPAKFH